MKFSVFSLTISLIFSAVPIVSLASDRNSNSIPTVDHVELESYVGLWYEISRIENEFQDNEPHPGDGPCFNTTAEYGFLPKGKISVKNSCYRTSGVEVAKAKAQTVPGSNNSKLKVNFTGIPLLEWLGIGNGDYWILGLGNKNSDNLYSWVLIGSPSLNYGWILSRTKNLPDRDILKALDIASSVGYDINLFKSFQR